MSATGNQGPLLWRFVQSFFRKATGSTEQKREPKKAELPKEPAHQQRGEPERMERVPGLSMTVQTTYHVSPEEERVRELMRATTALSETDPNAAVETFREAAALVPQTETDYGVAPFLRVPRYLQQAGRQEEAWQEFHNLLTNGYPNMQKGDQARHWIERDVYDKMRLFLQRENQPGEAVWYGVRSIISGIRVWTVPTGERRHRLESETLKIREREREHLRRSERRRIKRLRFELAEENLDKQLTKLLTRARLKPCHDGALALLCEWASRLPDADDAVYEAKLQKVLNEDTQ